MQNLIIENEMQKPMKVGHTDTTTMTGELSPAETTILLLMRDEIANVALLTFPVEEEQSITYRIEK